MNSSLGLILIVAAIVIYFLMVVAIVAVQRWRRKSIWPFKTEDKLLRGPGEELKRKIAVLDERLLAEMAGGICAGLVCFAIIVSILGKMPGLNPWFTSLAGILGMFTAFGVSGWRIKGIWRERQNCFLGWFGERYVAEWLEPIKLDGWRVFHDVPFVNNGTKFNIDHVVLGLGGVFAIETKTRRKGNARPGFKDNVVFFDGRDLVWPWAEDNHGLEQAERNALWLTDWIKAEIGEKVYVSPMLALPGWWLESKPARETRLCRVVNPKWLPGIMAKERPMLASKLVDLIALRLEALCRDVED